ncbi:MAG: hypothetical protein K9N47_11670 [Prosthecobacter sp.]|nr:hypothetical protein [Prosthecobacter sp.]
MNVIAESSLYNLIFKSRKTEAQAFHKWVTSEVLPSPPAPAQAPTPCPLPPSCRPSKPPTSPATSSSSPTTPQLVS